jgi:hypothetical protein
MNKLFAALLGASIGAVALTASAQTTPATTTTTPAAQTATATGAAAPVKKAVKARHHKHKKVAKANPAK